MSSTGEADAAGDAAAERASARPHDAARLGVTLDAWKRKLLDLTKRNRLLHHRPNKVATVRIVDELPAAVFRALVVEGRTLRFRPADVADADAVSDADDVTTDVVAEPAAVWVPATAWDEDTGEVDVSSFAPFDAEAAEARHTDDVLQTDRPPEALDVSLRRLDEQARVSVEEQGVHTLFLALGALHYTESADSSVRFRAPLVLVPVVLARRSARAGWTLRAGDDDPVVNPALVEHLRRQHGVELPELPDPSELDEGYDLHALLAAASAAVADRAGFAVEASIHLDRFSFQKLVMYNDLEAHAQELAAHALVRRLVLHRDETGDAPVAGLPDDVRTLDLDAAFAPESTHQVVDADSSQLRAVAAVARGHDLVIEGPPGTGKSQTITNVIAGALAAGRSVLFVAEKMAALSVVHDRLVRAGLGEFCLELHSTKTNKRVVMQELARTLDVSLQEPEVAAEAAARLPEARRALDAYVDAVHGAFGTPNVTPWHAYGALGEVEDAPRVAYEGPASDGATRATLDAALRALRDLVAVAAAVGVPAAHPWRDATRTFYAADDLARVAAESDAFLAELATLRAACRAAAAVLGLDAPTTLAAADAAAAVAGVVARSPGAPLGVLESAAWDAPPPDASAWIERGRALTELEARVLARLDAEALQRDHAEDIAYVERKASGFLGLFAFLDGRFRAIRTRWRGWLRPGVDASPLELCDDLRRVDRVRAERAAFDAAHAACAALFGELWRGTRSDWDALAAYVAWVVELRRLCVRHGLPRAALAVAAARAPDVRAAERIEPAVAAVRAALLRVCDAVGWPHADFAAAAFDVLEERVRGVRGSLERAPAWAAFEGARQAASRTLAAHVLAPALAGEVPFDVLERAFLRAFWTRFLTEAVRARPALERFHALAHEQRIAEFQELDRRVLVENRARLVRTLRARVQERLREPAAAECLPYLRGQMTRQRGIAPLRSTLRRAGAAVLAIKPCLMMSPLTVAQLLDGGTPPCDVVIFDEASQLPPEDAVGSVLRGRQLVVVGDPKQLPPTNFFAVTGGTVEAPRGEDGEPLFEDSESILEEFMAAGVATCRLKWHYRSAHESLIHFSNAQFYDAELRTFPSVERDTAERGLAFELVADGVYEGKGVNPVEARRVSEAVVAFAREELARRAAGDGARSLGVGTFNVRQQTAIQDELERHRREDPSLEAFFDRGAPEPFFVKNLENIQGDERDVIYLSVTYARGPDGRLRHLFGPLNGENGWRRLNVLATRARERMRVFSSIRCDDIGAVDASARGAVLLRDFLRYAERGTLDGDVVRADAATESPFERQVLRELRARGLALVPQVGAAGYRIDFGVVDDELPGRFVCGIECDGATYHASETARDRDRLRQQVLEARGWTIHRVWSTDWFKDRAGQVERLLALVAEDRRVARDRDELARRARQRAAEESGRRRAEEAEAARLREAADAAAASRPYARPEAAPYRFAEGAGAFAHEQLLEAPISRLVQAVRGVVDVEAPVHEAELRARVAAMWGSRVGTRIQDRIDEACHRAEFEGLVRRRGAFLWRPDGAVTVRSRSGTKLGIDRVAPEEIELAIGAVLQDGHGFTRAQLLAETRALLGYQRTGAAIEQALGAVVDALLAAGRLGEAASGIRLRD